MQTNKGINNQFRDKIQGLTKKFAAEYQAIDLSDSSTKKSQLENNLLDALIKYSIEGYKNRWMGAASVEGYAFERPAYEFIREALSHSRDLPFLNTRVPLPASETNLQSFAKKADIDGNKYITISETLNQFRRELVGVK